MTTPLIRATKLAAQLQLRGTKPFTLDGVRWMIHELDVVTEPVPMLRAVLSAKRGSEVLIAQGSPRNPFYWHNPPVMVVDGYEDDPTANKLLGIATPQRPILREDVTEVARQLLAQVL